MNNRTISDADGFRNFGKGGPKRAIFLKGELSRREKAFRIHAPGGSPGPCVLVHWMGSIRDGSKTVIIRRSLSDNDLATCTYRDVVPADRLTAVFTHMQWESLWPSEFESDE